MEAVAASSGRVFWRVTPRWPSMSEAVRYELLSASSKDIRTTIVEPDVTPLLEAGWKMHNAQAAVRRFEVEHGSRGLNISEAPLWGAFLSDKIHATPLANAAILHSFLEEECGSLTLEDAVALLEEGGVAG